MREGVVDGCWLGCEIFGRAFGKVGDAVGSGNAREGFRAYMYVIKAMESVPSRIGCCQLDLVVTAILH